MYRSCNGLVVRMLDCHSGGHEFRWSELTIMSDPKMKLKVSYCVYTYIYIEREGEHENLLVYKWFCLKLVDKLGLSLIPFTIVNLTNSSFGFLSPNVREVMSHSSVNDVITYWKISEVTSICIMHTHIFTHLQNDCF